VKEDILKNRLFVWGLGFIPSFCCGFAGLFIWTAAQAYLYNKQIEEYEKMKNAPFKKMEKRYMDLQMKQKLEKQGRQLRRMK